MIGIWNLQWLNQNSERAYPLADGASRVDVTGTFTLPDSFLLALYLPTHSGLDVSPGNFYLSRVVAFSTGWNVSISYDDGSASPPVVATCIVARATHKEYDEYEARGAGDFDDCSLRMVIGRTAEIDLQPAGDFTFSPAAGRLDTDCVRPMTRSVSSLAIVVGDERSARFAGDVELVAGANVRLTSSIVLGVARIRVDAVDGANLSAPCGCTEFDLPPAIRTINGIPPKANGDFDLLGSACVSLEPLMHGLRIEDSCSQPCCGDPELQKLVVELRHFGDEKHALERFISRLKAQVDSFGAVVLGSRLGDTGCMSC